MIKKILAVTLAVAMVLAIAITAVGAANIPEGRLTLSKVVTCDQGSIGIQRWLNARYGTAAEINEILSGISFELYRSNAGGVKGDKVDATGTLDSAGNIVFSPDVPRGWYLVSEVLSGKAALVFENAADVLVYFNGHRVTGGGSAFDYDAFYTIVNGYGQGYSIGYGQGNQLLNNSGDIFPISVRNSVTGAVYPSFCFHGGSSNFAGESGLGCSGYYIADYLSSGQTNYADFLGAFNYIENNLSGGLVANRAITQIVTWILLGSINVNTQEFEDIDWDTINDDNNYYRGSDAKADILDVIASSAGSAGRIIDLVVMECELHHNSASCQPQLVPVYNSRLAFANIPVPLGRLEIYKVFSTNVDGDYLDVEPDGYNATPTSVEFTVNGPSFAPNGRVYHYSDFVNGVLPLDNLIPGFYTVEETGGEVSGYSWGGAYYDSYNSDNTIGGVDVRAGETSRLTVTNPYDLGRLIVRKVIEGEYTNESVDDEFEITFNITGPSFPGDGFTFELSKANEWMWEFANIKFGDYTVTEVVSTAVINGITPTVTVEYEDGPEYAATIEITLDEQNRENPAVTFTNGYSTQREYGSLTISKNVTGSFNTGNVGRSYDFIVTGPSLPDGATITLPYEGSWSRTLYELETGRYTVREVTAGAQISPYTLNVTANGQARSEVSIDLNPDIPEGSQNIVYFVNDYSYNQYEPEYGRIIVTKAFNVRYVPGNWSATINVTGPGGYNQSRTITGANRTASFEGLEPGAYTVTEINRSGLANYTFLNVVGEGSYDVTRGATTQVTITNRYESEEEEEEYLFFDDEPPLAELPDDIIFDDELPLSDMPPTGIRDDVFALLTVALCAAILAAGGIGRLVRIRRK